MNSLEFKCLKLMLETDEETITSSDIEEISEGLGERTLLYGKTSSKFSWHIYFKNFFIHKLIYVNKQVISHKSDRKIEIKELIPSSGVLYPECCDYNFCMLLYEMRIDLPFATFNNTKKSEKFYGLIMKNDKV
jgi:hypothetical protein